MQFLTIILALAASTAFAAPVETLATRVECSTMKYQVYTVCAEKRDIIEALQAREPDAVAALA